MYTHRFSFLLYSLLLLFVASPILQTVMTEDTAKWTSLIFTFSFILILMTAIFAVCQTRKTLIFSIALATFTVIVDLLQEIMGGEKYLKLTYYASSSVFLTYTIVVVSGIIFTSPRVDTNIIKASICIYLLIGVLWAIIYSTIHILLPGSFNRPDVAALIENATTSTEAEELKAKEPGLMEDESGSGRSPESTAYDSEAMDFGSAETSVALYYSLVTLTTLGYGDITPLTPIARMFATLEAFIGQLYVAVLIARLVGIQISQAKDP